MVDRSTRYDSGGARATGTTTTFPVVLAATAGMEIAWTQTFCAPSPLGRRRHERLASVNGDPWSDAEDALVLDLTLSPAVIAKKLGRSQASVDSRRSRLRRANRSPGRDAKGQMRLPKGHTTWLIAKTCHRCDRLLGQREFAIKRDGGRNTFCNACQSEAVSERRREDPEFRAAFDGNVGRRQRQVQSASSGDNARNNRKEWTGPELEVVMRDDLSDREKAALLGRSFYAVRHMIRKMNAGDPTKVALAGLPTPRT